MQKILSTVRRAIDKYKLIQNGDKIAVGVSGGKDSLTLLKALKMYSRFSPEKFSIIAITIDMFNSNDFAEIENFCKEIDVELHIIPSNIYETVFEIRNEKNPCSLCSTLRRGILLTNAKKLGCNKVALGHSADDVTHTFFLSMLYEGRLSSFSPISYLDRTEMYIIRPLILTKESEIIKASKDFPIKKNKCPMDKVSKREYVKQLLKNISKEIPIAEDRIFDAITSPDRYNLFNKFEQDCEEFSYNQTSKQNNTHINNNKN